MARWMRASAERDMEDLTVPAPSAREALGSQDFSTFGDEALREVTKLARRIARKLASRPGRRWKPTPHGTRIFLRRTIREALKTGGEVSTLAYRERKLRKTRLVVLARCPARWICTRGSRSSSYALQNAFSRMETFPPRG
jgi:uncharacterized protein with von Willebrand factor type A (vWA) domain